MAQSSQETAKFWCDSGLENLEVLRATYVTHTFARHTHEGYAIGTIEAGVEAFTYQGTAYQAPTGSIVAIHPGEVHTGHAGIPDGWTYRMLYPSVSLMQKAAAECQLPDLTVPYFPNAVMHDPELATKFCQVHRAIETSRSPLERESRLLWLFAQLIARHAETRPQFAPLGNEVKQVQQIQDYLQANSAQSISLDDLAKLVHLKPLRVLRLFRQQVGLPPHLYLIQTRVANAKALLQEGVSLAQVAVDTGFTDQSHLTRHFKRWVGVTPKQYAIGCKNVQDF